MMLTPGLRRQLEEHFACPVLDVYSMNESGPIAVAHEGVHLLLQHHLYVEILDPEGNPFPPGVRGEVTLTGGLNFFLPLLRYRTNDYASLEWRDGQPVLIGLEGRPPVLYRGANGQLINNLDVTGALKHLALPQFTLHQTADGSLYMKARRSHVDAAQIRAALLVLFGPDQKLTIEEVVSLGEKVIQYTSDAVSDLP